MTTRIKAKRINDSYIEAVITVRQRECVIGSFNDEGQFRFDWSPVDHRRYGTEKIFYDTIAETTELDVCEWVHRNSYGFVHKPGSWLEAHKSGERGDLPLIATVDQIDIENRICRVTLNR